MICVKMTGKDFSDRLRAHHDSLIEGIRANLRALQAIPKSQRPKYVEGQIAYFKHLIAALTWSTRIAEQKAKHHEQ